MAQRPVFVPTPSGPPFVTEIPMVFNWYPGFAKVQVQKSIHSFHQAAAKHGIDPVLEISSKSPSRIGVALSAFNLQIRLSHHDSMSVECAFQGSKVFEDGGPFIDLYLATSREAKKDLRLRNSGNVIAFDLFGKRFPTRPLTVFYDWLYITALSQNPGLATNTLGFQGFTDIAHNPERSINCQARSAALFVALHQRGELDAVVGDFQLLLHLLTGGPNQGQPSTQLGQQMRLLS